eukprot:1442144-Amphidinium_carterae.1
MNRTITSGSEPCIEVDSLHACSIRCKPYGRGVPGCASSTEDAPVQAIFVPEVTPGADDNDDDYDY